MLDLTPYLKLIVYFVLLAIDIAITNYIVNDRFNDSWNRYKLSETSIKDRQLNKLDRLYSEVFAENIVEKQTEVKND